MIRLYRKNELLFALILIAFYVFGFSSADMLSEKIGAHKALTAALGLIFSVYLLVFIRKNGLNRRLGLCAFQGNYKKHLYFLPLILLSSVNLINGFQKELGAAACAMAAVSMLFAAFLEEVIFRGLLFNAMARDNLKAAVIVSSVTFGMGHIVNLLSGAPVLDTLLQLVYAAAAGFMFTALFLTGKSLIPPILSHAFINITSVFARPMSESADLAVAAFMTCMSILYGVWLLKNAFKPSQGQ